MQKIKNIIKKIIGKYNLSKIIYIKRIHTKYGKDNKNYCIINCLKNVKLIKNSGKAKQLKELLEKVRVGEVGENEKFYYYIDIFTTPYLEDNIMGNISLDYRQVLENSIEDIKKQIEDNTRDTKFCNDELKLIESIENYINKVILTLDKKKNKNIIRNLENIKNNRANSFEEAIQRILFFNQLMWQTGHYLNGLGRLDRILEKYYLEDLSSNKITKQEAINMLEEFVNKLHFDYYFKSNVINGDTGQIIEIGGTNINGEYECNDLTYIFIEIIKKLQLPDPKLFLRVNSKTPRELIEKAIDCVQTGIGCPLFANDDIIIPKLIEFGYKKEDAYNYVTSACWEPFIAGKSFDQNNEQSIVFMKPFKTLLESENLEQINDLENLLVIYKKYLKDYIIEENINLLNNKKYELDPLLSLFTKECIIKNKDITDGGAKYNHIGLTGVGISNLVNSILNIEELVFKSKEYSFTKFNEIRKQNYINNEELLNRLKELTPRYGTDSEEVIKITNDIIKYTSQIFKKYKNQFGGEFKFGLSAPSYITESKSFPASFDGRRNGEPFGVHISNDTSDAYTELIRFSSKLNYGENRFNGNVNDFFVSPAFIEDNFEKFVDFIILSIKVGFFEMQMNVVSSKTLIEARKNPDKFPNLIVRVWGFSSYFKDLPDEYKDYLIERALKSENKSN